MQNFTQARYIRMRLQKIRTLNADLMTFLTTSPDHLAPSVTNRVRPINRQVIIINIGIINREFEVKVLLKFIRFKICKRVVVYI